MERIYFCISEALGAFKTTSIRHVNQAVDSPGIEYDNRPGARTSSSWGVKTQTRRRHVHPLQLVRVYAIKTDWFHRTDYKIKLIRVYRQRLMM